jgi:hypothetical protein
MSRTPDLKRYALWRECIGRQVDSGLTIAQFCAREGVSVAAFHSWKRQLRLIEFADHRPASPDSLTFLPVSPNRPCRTRFPDTVRPACAS